MIEGLAWLGLAAVLVGAAELLGVWIERRAARALRGRYSQPIEIVADDGGAEARAWAAAIILRSQGDA